MKSLRELDALNEYQTDKLGRCSVNSHDYCDPYERHFSFLRGQVGIFWEIGIDRGGSLKMWADYFGPGVRVVGFDVKHRPPSHELPGNCVWVEGDATDKSVIEKALYHWGVPDAVLDDGSHLASHMGKTFDLAWPFVKSVYAVEDLGTQYHDKHGASFLDSEPFTDRIKAVCDLLARYDRTTVSRVTWEPGIVFLHK